MRGELHLHVLNVINRRFRDVNIVGKQGLNIDALMKNVNFQDLIKMTNVILTLKVMPNDVEVNLDELQDKIKSQINSFTDNDEIKIEVTDIAFGLKALNFMFVMDEGKGSTDELESSIQNVEGVKSVEVTDVRRALG
jgi:elongation factor 1-beta